ncbi:uncharacterized protein JCM6883_003203 [Sporobolomyces salmoneus]|uniref:uncharacterized protein n=1 Tax=Sporobolomyces salmoneus TaxID=183962 RepID=UPI0031816E71
MKPNGSYYYPLNQPPYPQNQNQDQSYAYQHFYSFHPQPQPFPPQGFPFAPNPYPFDPYLPQQFGYPPPQAYPPQQQQIYGYSQPVQAAPPPLPPPTRPSTSTSRITGSVYRDPRSPDTPLGPTSPACSDQLRDQELLDDPRNMSSTDEYGVVLREISGMTVDKLKLALRKLNEVFGGHLKYSGLKAELYQRLRGEIDRIWTYDKARFPTAKMLIAQAFRGIHSNTLVHGPPSFDSTGRIISGSSSNDRDYRPQASGGYGASTSSATTNYGSSSSNYGRPPLPTSSASSNANVSAGFSRYGANGTSGMYQSGSSNAYGGGGGATAATINRWQNDDVPIKFRPSPFYRVEKSLSPPVTLIKADQGDRKVGIISFGLTEPQRTLLTKAKESPANPQYEVRLYCTSDNNYSIGRPHASQFPAPIEFPGLSEIKLNNVTINVNTKGIKKQPGTTPPVNLSSKKGPTVAIGPGQLNRVEVIYTNTERTTYYMVAYLVEVTPVKKVVEKVKAGRTKPKEEVIQSIKDINADEEIAAGPLGLSLRDPLSFARIGIPIRSKSCNHISCFDAETWFEMNEQTPTWGCPICSKTLKFEDMVVDGYFEDILKTCPSSVDAVTVNPDGTWRSDDNKHGTGPPRVEKPSTGNNSNRNSPPRSREESTKPDISNEDGNGKGKGKAQPEAFTLDSDSDDNDEPLAKRPRFGGYGGGGGASHSNSPFVGGAGTNGVRNGRGASEVLDLTLSDSDDDQPPAARPPLQPHDPSLMRFAGGTGNGAGPARPGGGVKSVAEVQRDIDAMHERMRQEYGDDWRTRFNP